MKYRVVFDNLGFAVMTWSEQEYQNDFGHLKDFHPEFKEFDTREDADQFRLEHNEKKMREKNVQ